MATRSMIGYYDAETGTVAATYCHWDGYYSGVGATLMEYYNTDTLAYGIANLGYISSLEATIGDTLAGRHNVDEPIVYDSVDDFLSKAWSDTGAEYIYLHDGTTWFGADFQTKRFTDMETLLEEYA